MFQWDGLDSYGRELERGKARIRTVYYYRRYYFSANDEFETSFGEPGDYSYGFGAIRSMGQYVSISRGWSKELLNDLSYSSGLGGWTISPHHNSDRIPVDAGGRWGSV